ncbi:MAG TPA: hypothetical protein VMS65_04185 [Polyangiaceae bacterium]|nr:hypothetical protein [Polyangiaceae bacterium]
MKFRCHWVIRSSIVVALGAIGCADPAASDVETVEFGATISRTGTSAVKTWELALDMATGDASDGLRAAGFPTGARLDFKARVADTVNKTENTVSKGRALVGKGAKMLMVGTSSDAVALSALAYDDDDSNDIDVPIVCIACSSPALHNPMAMNDDPVLRDANRNELGWVFGLAMASTYQSQVLWNIITDKTPPGNPIGDINGDGRVKISTVAQSDGFGTGFQNALEAIAVTPDIVYEKLTFATTEDVNQEQVWNDLVDALTDDRTIDVMGNETVDREPDVVIEFAFPQFSLALVKAYAARHKTQTFLHTHSMRERPVVLSAESALDGHEGTSYVPSDGESGEIFDRHFSDEYGVARESQWDSGAYDTGFLTALAVLKAGMEVDDPTQVTGEGVRDALKTLNDKNGMVIRPGSAEFAKAAQEIADGRPIDYEGASGPCDFDEYGRALNRIAHWRANNQMVETLAVYNCIADPSCPRE